MVYFGLFLFCLTAGVTPSQSATAFTEIGGSCTNINECTIPDASCQAGICVCNSDFVPRSDKSECLPVVTNYQGACEESIQCKIPNVPDSRLSCEGGRCVCHQQFSFRDGSCVGQAQLGESCLQDRDCLTSATDSKVVWCFNYRCSCRKGYVANNSRCVIGGNCENDYDCSGESNSGLANSFCDKRTRQLFHCACRQGYVPAVNDTECLEEKSKLGESCVDDVQCSKLLGAAVCKSNSCACAPNAEEQDGKCNEAPALASIPALLLLLAATRFIL